MGRDPYASAYYVATRLTAPKSRAAPKVKRLGYWCLDLDLPKPFVKRGASPRLDNAQVVEAYELFGSHNKAAEYLGCRPKTVRRHLKRHNGGSHSYVEWLEILERHGNKCARCGVQGHRTEREKRLRPVLQRDHIVPICKGGTDDASNIQPLCLTCNSVKGRN